MNIERNIEYSVAIYIRLSKEDGDKEESESVTNQRKILRAFAEENHYRVYDEYVDDGYTGTNFNRPDFKRMITDIENKKVNMVITKSLSRLGRDYIETGRYIEKYFPENNIRYIAVLDDVDTFLDKNCDTVALKNIFNDFFAKETSKNVKRTKNKKKKEGFYYITYAPFGYKKDENDKNKWIIDEPAAKIIKRVFALFIQGFSPSQIAKKFTEEGIMNPTEYHQSLGMKTQNPLSEVKHYWYPITVTKILDRQEYIGDTINFRYTTRSFKDKTKIKLPKDQWKIFKNTHEAIIDEETWNTAQRLRDNKQRPTRTGKISIFSGHLFCRDCGAKLYYCTANNFTPDKDFYRCSNYKNNSTKSCTSHNIKDYILKELVLDNIKQVISYISSYEDLFIKEKLENSLEEQRKKDILNKKLLSQYEKRVKDIDNLIQHIYEDNISGKITDDRFATLSLNYEREQKDLKEKISHLANTIDKTKQQELDLTTFIDKVKKYTEIKELTPEIINELIDKICTHFPFSKVKCLFVKAFCKFITTILFKIVGVNIKYNFIKYFSIIF